jgi:dienelactone hydrolase
MYGLQMHLKPIAPKRSVAAVARLWQFLRPSCSAAQRLAQLALGCAALAPVQAQQWVVQPAAEVLAGTPLNIRLTGLKAGEEITIDSLRMVREGTGQPRPYRASARFVVAADGSVSLNQQAPLAGGSYSGADVRGLFWSMQPSNVPASENAPGHTAELAAHHVVLQARRGEGVLASQLIQLHPASPHVQQRDAGPFAGAKFAFLADPASNAAKPIRRPALILLGGSEGDDVIVRGAAAFASRGYAVLALPYYSPPTWGPGGPGPSKFPSLPAAFADIPIDRLEEARAWLERQPEADATRIGVVGTSKGAEFALLAAVRMPWIKAVLAMVPSDVVWEGWGAGIAADTRSSFSWQGQPLPYVPYVGMDKEFAGFATGADVRIRRPQDAGRAAHPARVPLARIPVERIKAPVMVVGGHDDQLWDSGTMAQNIVATRQAAGLKTVALIYRDAGHWLGGHGYGPTTQYNAGPYKVGGTPQANAQAQAEAFVRGFEFLAQALGPVPE